MNEFILHEYRYLAAKSEAEHYIRELKRERDEIVAVPDTGILVLYIHTHTYTCEDCVSMGLGGWVGGWGGGSFWLSFAGKERTKREKNATSVTIIFVGQISVNDDLGERRG